MAERRPFGTTERRLWAVVLLIWVYVAIRSHMLGFTWDEISTLDFARDLSWRGITRSAGAHLLPAVFIRLFHDLEMNGEFIMRLPSTLAFLAYAWAAIDLGRFFRQHLAVVLFALLVVNPFVLDFFSLARGYGPALGAMLPSLAFAIRYHHHRQLHLLALSLFLAMLSVVANYTMLNFFLPYTGALMLLLASGKESIRERFGHMAMVLLTTLALLSAVLPVLLTLSGKGELYYGGRNGLFTDTIASIGRVSAYHVDHAPLASVVFQAIVVLAIGSAIWTLVRSMRSRTFGVPGATATMLVLALLAPLAQNVLFGTYLPVERTALFLHPLLALAFVQGLANVPARSSRWPGFVVVILLVVHFGRCANVTITYSWRFESGAKALVKHLVEHAEGDIHVGLDFVHLQSTTHYRDRSEQDGLHLHGLTECWEYCMELPELNPRYFGVEQCARALDPESVRSLFGRRMDAYYLDDTVLAALDNAGMTYETLARFAYSRTSLVHIQEP